MNAAFEIVGIHKTIPMTSADLALQQQQQQRQPRGVGAALLQTGAFVAAF